MSRLIRLFRGTANGGMDKQEGKIGYLLLWLLGVPIPLLVLFALLRSCA